MILSIERILLEVFVWRLFAMQTQKRTHTQLGLSLKYRRDACFPCLYLHFMFRCQLIKPRTYSNKTHVKRHYELTLNIDNYKKDPKLFWNETERDDLHIFKSILCFESLFSRFYFVGYAAIRIKRASN